METLGVALGAIVAFVKNNAAAGVAGVVGALFSGFVSARYGEIFKIRDATRQREEKTDDLLNSAYHEVGLDLVSNAAETTPDQLKAYLRKMLVEPDYFPIWTSYPEELFVFENQIKKEAAILPEDIKPTYYQFYQSHLYAKQYLVDARSKDVLALPQPRRVRFLCNLYDACFESMCDACLAARAFERVDVKRGRRYFDLDWAVERFDLRLPSNDLDHVTTRWLAYLAMESAIRREQRRSWIIARAALKLWEKREEWAREGIGR